MSHQEIQHLALLTFSGESVLTVICMLHSK